MNELIDRFVGQVGIPVVLRPAIRDAMRLVADIASHRERERAIKFCATSPLTGAELATALARSLHSSPQKQGSSVSDPVNSGAVASISETT